MRVSFCRIAAKFVRCIKPPCRAVLLDKEKHLMLENWFDLEAKHRSAYAGRHDAALRLADSRIALVALRRPARGSIRRSWQRPCRSARSPTTASCAQNPAISATRNSTAYPT